MKVLRLLSCPLTHCHGYGVRHSTVSLGSLVKAGIAINDSQLAIGKATVPILDVHGEGITRAFYRNLFEAHPELKDIFSMADQVKADQPRASPTH